MFREVRGYVCGSCGSVSIGGGWEDGSFGNGIGVGPIGGFSCCGLSVKGVTFGGFSSRRICPFNVAFFLFSFLSYLLLLSSILYTFVGAKVIERLRAWLEADGVDPAKNRELVL